MKRYLATEIENLEAPWAVILLTLIGVYKKVWKWRDEMQLSDWTQKHNFTNFVPNQRLRTPTLLE